MATQVLRIHTSLADDMSAAIGAFLSYCRAKNLSANTTTYYAYRLQAFERFCAANHPGTTPGTVATGLLREFLSEEANKNSAATANHSHTALRTFFNFLVSDGFIAENPMSEVKKLKRRTKVIETFTMEQVERILATCGKDFAGVRDSTAAGLLA